MIATGTLRFDDIVKSFGGTQTLKGVSIELQRGEIVVLVGENGSGKSTQIKSLSGALSIHGNSYQCFGAKHTIGKGRGEMALDVESVLDDGVD